MYERQARIADWKAGPFTSTPFTVVLFGVCWIWRGRRPAVGSGKLETPCDRMQDANSSVLLPLASELWPADAFAAVPLGLDEPHAARPKAAAASRLMMIVNRIEASLRFGFASEHYEIGGNRPRCSTTIPTSITGIDTGFNPRAAFAATPTSSLGIRSSGGLRGMLPIAAIGRHDGQQVRHAAWMEPTGRGGITPVC
jgi:hypothetical protein